MNSLYYIGHTWSAIRFYYMHSSLLLIFCEPFVPSNQGTAGMAPIFANLLGIEGAAVGSVVAYLGYSFMLFITGSRLLSESDRAASLSVALPPLYFQGQRPLGGYVARLFQLFRLHGGPEHALLSLLHKQYQ